MAHVHLYMMETVLGSAMEEKDLRMETRKTLAEQTTATTIILPFR